MPETQPGTRSQARRSGPTLESGSRVAVIGGGPSGSFFSYFLFQMAQRLGLDLQVDIFEPRDFSAPGPLGCNMCGGIVSESLVQHLAAEGINLPVTVIQRRIDSYFLHMDVGSVLIETPLQEKRIAAVHRGGGPRGRFDTEHRSFDGYLLEMATQNGARWIRDRVERVEVNGGRPSIITKKGTKETYDLLAVAVGVNSAVTKLFQNVPLSYKPPGSTKAYVCEFYLGVEMLKRYIGSSMHVFLLDIPGIEFAALIPKSDFVTVCLLGEKIDDAAVKAFLRAPEVQGCMPPHWTIPEDFCHCSPRLNIRAASRPFADRMIFIGDCGASRLYKDGIGAAYRTAKAAAVTAVFEGIGAEDFNRHFWPACQSICRDNRIGKLVFTVTRVIQHTRLARQGLWRMVSKEQKQEGGHRRMSTVLWDTFTGSAPYKDVFLRSLHPSFLGNFFWETVKSGWRNLKPLRQERIPMLTGQMGKEYKHGEIIFRQGDLGDCMYIVHKGQIEIVQRKGDKEYCLNVLEQGDFFGEMGIFEPDVRTVTARALGNTTVITLEKKSLLRRLHEDPSLAYRLLKKMSQRIRDLETKLVRVGSASP